MLADFYTKPLQGKLYHKYRRIIMGWDYIDVLQIEKKIPVPLLSQTKEERVENDMIDKNVMSFVQRKNESYADILKKA